ncbi:nucleotide exchange factor GrpE [Aggregatilineales bacterium SYSU G02658]
MSDTNHQENTPHPAADEVVAPVETDAPAEVNRADEIISKLQEEARVNLEGWQRARAEFANYKKRIESEIKSASERGAHDALIKMLPIMDDFQRALDNIPEDLKSHPWVSGTALIMKHFDKVLEAYHVTEVDPVGQPFDPHLHEAIGMDDSGEHPSGTVTATMQKGYVSGDRVLRPALVKVAQ